ncbi:DtxR family Mn-dependent transcriptional regulator [Lewinella marina]|uniref:Transcriptional regulator MntR n=1 Tax=Neolewinella marina TaxID=438751 RepID=A0A2G0CII8_9BACT|nr:metal-dependent transcriptional regulator [Neolewinella marina]NJB85066.1 DtxR family Mn-dependent transcriptional regulator [Neolewinella marina]PHK99792.1 iron (metal) dependent repressor, dtxr family protein [Neolewinella marina]
MASPTVENYLKALLALSRQRDTVSISDLSAELGVSKPSANSMIKRLAEQGLLEYERYRPLRLTEEGRKQAALVVRKHRLTEMYLVEKMGFGWEEVHPIAEQIEHIDSPALFERMDQLLGSPDFDPHGSPIPDRQGNISARIGQRLSGCEPGDVVILTGLENSSPDFLRYLNEKGLRLDAVIKVAARESYDGSMRIIYGGREETLPKGTADQLLVATQLRAPASGTSTR